MFLHQFQIISDQYVFQSVNCLTSTYIMSPLEYLKFFMSYPSQIIWKHSLDVCTPVCNNFRFLVCMKFLTLGYLQFWMDQLSLTDILGIFVNQLQIISNILNFCQSVHCPTSLLKYSQHGKDPVHDELSFSNVQRHSCIVCTLVLDNFRLQYVCQSVSLHQFFTDIMSHLNT